MKKPAYAVDQEVLLRHPKNGAGMYRITKVFEKSVALEHVTGLQVTSIRRPILKKRLQTLVVRA